MSINAVIYARYSSDNQREESIEGQLRECKAFAKKQGMLLVETYIDRALSAKTDDRPDFQRMIKDSENGLFDVVIVWKLDRFSRDRYDSAEVKGSIPLCSTKIFREVLIIKHFSAKCESHSPYQPNCTLFMYP